MKVVTINRIHYLALSVGVLLSIIAMIFYWTRYWIDFTPQAIPWLLWPLIPYAIIGVAGFFINRKKQTKRVAVILLVGSTALLALTAWFYVPFLDGALIFYLRMALGMSATWLGTVAAIFTVMAFLLSIGGKPTNKVSEIRYIDDRLFNLLGNYVANSINYFARCFSSWRPD